MNEKTIRKGVRERYARIASDNAPCCGKPATSSKQAKNRSEKISRDIGYTMADIEAVPEGANMGLGCGNPIALASLKEGETVLDLGSGGGFDCFLAARKVGKTGRVIGVDMTPEMIDKARENAGESKYVNVEFRLGEIENLPVADHSVDVIISNCVINLSPKKKRVFEEAFRVLKPKGRLMISDIVLSKKLPKEIENNIQAYASCVSGAEIRSKYLELIREAGFEDVKVIKEDVFDLEDIINDPESAELLNTAKISKDYAKEIATTVSSVKVSATKQ